jgi:hypothetical protein
MHISSSTSLRGLVSGAVVAAALAASSTASAQPPDPALLERVSHHLKAIDEMGKRASMRVEQLVEELDGDGKVSSTKTEVTRVETDGKTVHQVVERCVKDGKDVLADCEKEAKKEDEKQAKAQKDDDESLTMPFGSDGYVYDQVGVDAADPTRVEIAFKPKTPTKHTLEGKAWIDTTSGTIISAGAKLSKPPMLVDYVHFTVELGEKTSLGPALSHMTFDAKVGILFIHKRIRGDIKMSDYRIVQ